MLLGGDRRLGRQAEPVLDPQIRWSAAHQRGAPSTPLFLPQAKQFYTAPTLIRSLMRFGDDYVQRCDRSSLRILGSVGEPINPEAWRWYHDVS